MFNLTLKVFHFLTRIEIQSSKIETTNEKLSVNFFFDKYMEIIRKYEKSPENKNTPVFKLIMAINYDF